MVSLINVVNNIDKNNKPVGHGLKSIQDFSEILDENIEILASKEYCREFIACSNSLPYSIRSGQMKHSSLKMLVNYFVSLFSASNRTLLYVIAAEPLLWGIALMKRNKRVVVLTYDNWDLYIRRNLSDRPIRKFLVKRGLDRTDGFIVTNLSYRPRKPYIRIPDFFMTEEMKMYARKPKEHGCICIGEMRYGKDVAGLSRVMGKTDIPLLIIGSFSDKSLYQSVRRVRSENIKVVDKNLEYSEYLEYLSAYRYVVLPYDADYYDGRTSGILLEGIFVGAIPIAPCTLLKQNRIQGLGYKDISQIPELIAEYEAGNIDVHNDLRRFEEPRIKGRLNMFLKNKGFLDE